MAGIWSKLNLKRQQWIVVVEHPAERTGRSDRT